MPVSLLNSERIRLSFPCRLPPTLQPNYFKNAKRLYKATTNKSVCSDFYFLRPGCKMLLEISGLASCDTIGIIQYYALSVQI